MKKTILLLLITFGCLTGFSQSKYFMRDTLDSGLDKVTNNKYYRIGEIWYLTPISKSVDTLTFTRNFYLNKSTNKFEFDNFEQCFVESNRLSCGEWASGFSTKYKIKGDVVEFFKSDNWPPVTTGKYTIAEYSQNSMTLIKVK